MRVKQVAQVLSCVIFTSSEIFLELEVKCVPFNPVKMCFLEEEWDVRLKIRKWNEENWYPFPSLSPKTKDVGCFRQNSTWSRPRATYLILTYDYKYFVFPREATYETKMKWKSLLTGSFGQKNLPITKKYVCRNTQEKSLVFFYIRSAWITIFYSGKLIFGVILERRVPHSDFTSF